jgi:TOMM system kinase/cyclase fusion protein
MDEKGATRVDRHNMRESTQVPDEIRAPFKERYEFLHLIGQGGFGQVYKARQLTTDQEVAIKILRPPPGGTEHQREKQLARFRREMRICSRLFHPNIVRPMDSGQTESGLLFSVFEFVPGQNLADVLAREGALDPREVLRLMTQILDALDCAHRRGVVHRDIKPQNIMITDTGARRNALVLDFGISTVADEFNTAESVSAISSLFEVLGTPAYAAPEQLRGQHPDMRSDLYSWGLVHLECLTGEMAMKGRTLQEVIERQLGPEPVPIPEALAGLRLGELLRQATVKDIDKRSVTAASLLGELEACAQEEGNMVARRFAVARSRSAQSGEVKRTKPPSGLFEGHLRQITALCCGVSMLPVRPGRAGMDVEERDCALRAAQQRCIEIAEEFGGYPGGVLGQESIFYFGYPTAREDAPRSAARAAIKLLDEATARQPELEAKYGLRMELRIGIHTGPSVIRDALAQERRDFPSVLGTTPTIASQHQAMAEPGEALVSQDTWRLLRNDFAFESVQRTEPRTYRSVAVFRLSATSAPELAFPDTPLAGRELEVETLLEHWTQVRQGVGQGILLTGEPGIGKSRLIRELCRRLSGTPHTLLEARCAPEDRTSALHPIGEMLEHLLGRRRDWPPERALRELEALLTRYGFELAETVPLFASLLSIPLGERYAPLQATPEWQKALTFEAVLDLLVEMAAQQPVLMIVEDLHWADATTLELLTFLLEAVASARLGVIFTARSEFVPPWSASQTHQLQLGRLRRSNVELMVQGLTAGRSLPPEVIEHVASKTDGIPLFVEELTRTMLDSGLLKKEGEGYQLTGSLSGLAVPGTLRGLLEARLDRLGRARETAELASLLGREFNYEMLHALSPSDERTLQADLSALVASELLQHRRRLHDSTYVFKHALIKEAAYESIPRATRRELHARISSVLEEQFPALVKTRPELLAWHHAAADQKARAIGYALLAAQSALRRSAHPEAIAHATQALEWLDALPDQGRQRMERELEINSVLLPALMSAQGWTAREIEAKSRRSQELITALGESPYAAQTLCVLATYHQSRAEFAIARERAASLLEQARSSQDRGLESLAMSLLGENNMQQGNLVQARKYLERSLELYDDDPAQARAMAQSYGMDPQVFSEALLGVVLCHLGAPTLGLTHALSGARLSRQLDHPLSEMISLMFLLITYQLRGERDPVPAIAEQGLKLAERYGLPVGGAYFRIHSAWATRNLEQLERNLDKVRAFGVQEGLSYYVLLQAQVELELKRHVSALQHLEDILEWTRKTGETCCVPFLLELKARVLLELDRQKDAESSLMQAIEIAEAQEARMPELRAVTTLCRLLIERNEHELARKLLGRLLSKSFEGLDSRELQEAQALFQLLSHEGVPVIHQH